MQSCQRQYQPWLQTHVNDLHFTTRDSRCCSQCAQPAEQSLSVLECAGTAVLRWLRAWEVQKWTYKPSKTFVVSMRVINSSRGYPTAASLTILGASSLACLCLMQTCCADAAVPSCSSQTLPLSCAERLWKTGAKDERRAGQQHLKPGQSNLPQLAAGPHVRI